MNFIYWHRVLLAASHFKLRAGSIRQGFRHGYCVSEKVGEAVFPNIGEPIVQIASNELPVAKAAANS